MKERARGKTYRLVAVAIVAAVVTTGCAPRLSTPEAHRLLERLFAPPTSAERAAVLAEWRGEEIAPEEVRVELERREENGRRTLVLSHEVEGERHYGAVRVPPGGAGRSLPVLVVAHGGDRGASGYLFFHAGPFAEEWIQVVPSYRSERLYLTPFRIYRSQGISNPWDGDVEDSMGLLGAVLEHVPEADSARVAVMGHSRGGGVALLMGIRDARVKAVVGFASPTDLFLPEVRAVAERGLRLPLPRLPGANYLADSVLFALRDGRVSTERARLELLRRSPAWFVAELPPTQLHHGMADPTVPFAHWERIRRQAQESGAEPLELYAYPGGRHRTRTLKGAMQRAERFLAPFRAASPEVGELVVLVHGMGRTAASMKPLERVLEREGYRVLRWQYSSACCSVADLGARLQTEVAEHRGAAERVHFVGHSLGNVLIRWALTQGAPTGGVGRVVMLAPPNQGSRAADLVTPWLGWLFRPLPELRTHPASTARSLPPLHGVSVGVIAGKYDAKVSTVETHLDGESAHVVVPAAHTFLMHRGDVQRLVLEFLRQGSFDGATEPAH